MRRLIVVPRWGATPDMVWYPWLVTQLQGRFAPIDVADMPEPGCPTVDGWTAKLGEVLGQDRDALAQTVVAGHSVACQAILHALARLPAGVTVAGVLCVGAWWDIDEPWETIEPWIAAAHDLDAVRAAAPTIRALIGDNDPFTADWEETRRQWRGRVGAQVDVHAGAGHFNAPEAPMVRDALLEWA